MAMGDGITSEPLPREWSVRPTLNKEQAEELAGIGLRLERGFGAPQDVEWSYQPEEGFIILQSRPLHIPDFVDGEDQSPSEAALILYGGGETACPGVAYGRVHLVF